MFSRSSQLNRQSVKQVQLWFDMRRKVRFSPSTQFIRDGRIASTTQDGPNCPNANAFTCTRQLLSRGTDECTRVGVCRGFVMYRCHKRYYSRRRSRIHFNHCSKNPYWL